MRLLFLDRIGIVADISRRVADQAMNSVSMEVERKQQLADVYLEVDPLTREMSEKGRFQFFTSTRPIIDSTGRIIGTKDIRILADHFLFQINCKLGTHLQLLTSEALDKRVRLSWPGNVRELINVIERASIFCDTTVIGVESILGSYDLLSPELTSSGAMAIEEKNNRLTRQLDALERQIVTNTLKSARGIRQAGGRLGISHTTLRNKIKKHRLWAICPRTPKPDAHYFR